MNLIDRRWKRRVGTEGEILSSIYLHDLIINFFFFSSDDPENVYQHTQKIEPIAGDETVNYGQPIRLQQRVYALAIETIARE